MSLWKRLRVKWTTPLPLIAFAILFTLPWVEVSCNYQLSDDIQQNAIAAERSGRANLLSELILARSERPPSSLTKKFLETATAPAVATQSGWQAALGGYTEASTLVDAATKDQSEKLFPTPPGPEPLLILCGLCVCAGLSAAVWLRPGRTRGLAVATAACVALGLLFWHDLAGFRIADRIGPANVKVAREFQESRKIRASQNVRVDDAPFTGPPTLELRDTLWYDGAFIALILGVLLGMAESRASPYHELGGETTRSRRNDAALALAAVSFTVLCVSGWMWRTTKQAHRAVDARHFREARVAQAKMEVKQEEEAVHSVDQSLVRRYLADMTKIEEAWLRDDLTQARQVLESQGPHHQAGVDRRGFEWYYWQGKLTWDDVTFKGHQSGVRCVAFSSNGSRLASGGVDGTVIVWNRATRKAVRTISAHPGGVGGIVFSPDGKRLATGGTDHAARIWDAVTATKMQTFNGHADRVSSVAFAPDGHRIATASLDHTVKVWDASSSDEVLTFRDHPDQVNCVTFSSDGRWLASAGRDGTALVWDALSGKLTQSFPCHTEIWTVAFSPDGHTLACGGTGPAGTITLWNTETSRPGASLNGHQGSVNAVVFAPGGKYLASAGQDGTMRIWNPTTGKERLTIVAHTAPVNSVSWSPDGKALVSASWDGTVKVWTAAITNEGTVGPPQSLDVSRFDPIAGSPPRYKAEFAADGVVKITDASTGQSLSTLPGHGTPVRSAAFDHQGTRVATAGADGTVRLWDIATGLQALTLSAGGSEITRIAFSRDGSELAAIGRDGIVRLWDGSRQDPAPPRRVNRVVSNFKVPIDETTVGANRAIAIAPDGQQLALADETKTVRLMNPRNGRPTGIALEGGATNVVRLSFSADGRRLAAARANSPERSEAGVVTVWNVATGQKIQTLPAQPKPITSLAFSFDGTHVATACMDQSIKLWDADSSREAQNLVKNALLVSSLAFSPADKWLAYAEASGNVTIVLTESGQRVKSLKTARYFVAGIAFSPSGRLFAAPADDGVKVWDTKTWGVVAALRSGKLSSIAQGEVAAFSSDGQRLVSIGAEATAWDTQSWQQIGTSGVDPTAAGAGFGGSRPAMSGDGNWLVTLSRNGTVRLWNMSPLNEPFAARPAGH
jgi:WD40 repeat protein